MAYDSYRLDNLIELASNSDASSEMMACDSNVTNYVYF